MSVIGFRRWKVAAGLLHPVGITEVPAWGAGANHAQCLCFPALDVERCDHPVIRNPTSGDSRAGCGLYAYKTPIPPCACGMPSSLTHGAVGVVRMWGRCVEHQYGWRAEYASVAALVDFTGQVDPAYDVPKYPDLQAMYGEWAPGEYEPFPDHAVWCVPWQRLAVPVSVDMSAFIEALEQFAQAASQVAQGITRFGERAVRAASAALPPPRPADRDPRLVAALEAQRTRNTGPKQAPFRRRGKG